MIARRVRRTKYPRRKTRVVLRAARLRENKRSATLRASGAVLRRASNREISYGYLRRWVPAG